MIDLQKLARFVALARAGSYAQAARELHVTQPSLTRSVQTLESQLGVRLLDRDRGRSGIMLTQAGADLLRHANELLQGADRLELEVTASAARRRRRVSFGIGSMLASVLVEDLLVALLAEHPSFVTSVATGDPETMTGRLLAGGLDFYIGPATPSHMSPRMRSRFVGRLRTRFVVRAAHPLARAKTVTVDEVVHYPLIADTAWQDATPSPGGRIDHRLFDTVVHVDSHIILVDLARRSDAIMVTGTGSLPTGLVELRMDIDLTSTQTDISLFTVDHRTPSGPAREVADRLCRLLRDATVQPTTPTARPSLRQPVGF